MGTSYKSWPRILHRKSTERNLNLGHGLYTVGTDYKFYFILFYFLLHICPFRGFVDMWDGDYNLHPENFTCQGRDYFVMRHAATLSEPGVWVGCCPGSNDALLHVWMVVNCSWQETVAQRWIDIRQTSRMLACLKERILYIILVGVEM